MHVDTAQDIVNTLLEDIDADLPSHKSEVRILPTGDPRRFDVTLLTGFDPIYVGTVSCQGNVWKPVEVMPGVGRQFRSKLHFVGPNKEDVAMAMVQTLRPIWKAKITPHLQVESDTVDPKAFVQQKIGYDIDIKRVIETEYPNVEVLGVTAEPDYRLRYIATIRSKDPAQPLWHQPIYSMIQDLQRKLWKLYGWKMRPYAHQERYPANIKFDGVAGIKPISICYDHAQGQPGAFNLLIDFDILKKDDTGDYAEQENWGTPYESLQEDLSADIAKEADKADKPASKEQADAGNYRKGHISLHGFQIAIENAKGSTRSGTNKNGTPWRVTMPAHYGYIKGTQGKDKDHLDVYIGPKPDGLMVFVVNQKKEEGGFDEHKIMLGFGSKDEAIATYDRAFTGNLGPKLRETVVSTTMDGLKSWIASGNTKKPFDGITESLVAGLLEEEGGLGFNSFKDFVLNRVTAPPPPGTKIHIGFSISTSDQHMIEARANDDAVEVDWDAVNAAIPIIEKNAMTALEEQGIKCRSEGHDSYGDLVGTAWVEIGTGGEQIVREFIERDEPFSTSSGNIEHIQQGLGLRLYQGVPENIAVMVDVDISFFDLDQFKSDLEIDESDMDSKSLAMRTPMRPIPMVWGDLKPGDVLYEPETGSYERIEGFKDGVGVSYQDETGRLVYDSRPAKFVLYSQFGPAYAYGHFVQHLSSHPKHGLLGAELVELDDTSDEALWKLVDEEMYRNGTTPEELEQSRADHRARLAAEPPERADARRRMAELMDRVPPPPQNESDDADPKAFLGRHELPVELEAIHDNAWRVYRKDDHYPLGNIHFDMHEDAPSHLVRQKWKDVNWIAIPITPSVQPQAFKDQDEAVEFLLQHGNR